MYEDPGFKGGQDLQFSRGTFPPPYTHPINPVGEDVWGAGDLKTWLLSFSPGKQEMVASDPVPLPVDCC